MDAETRYAKSGALNIAYQVVGDGPVDLVLAPGWVSHVEDAWGWPERARMLERLASFSRLIVFDKRGTGMSDRVPDRELPGLDERMDDLRAVLDAVGSERAALLGYSEGGPLCALFAASHPDRTQALVLYASYARWIRDADYPWAPTRAQHEEALRRFEEGWGTPVGFERMAPGLADDARSRRLWAASLRRGASPGAALALYRMNVEIDVRHVLPSIRVPTLVLHRSGDRLIYADNGRYLARSIPDARYVELPGDDHLPFAGDMEAWIGEVQEFLTGSRQPPEPDRVLATVLFVDLVDSTGHALRLGDARWASVLEAYHAAARRALERFRGREIDTAGDGLFAAFDGPARAVRCAFAIREAVRELGMQVRAGVHTGECERVGEKIGGIAVHIGARVGACAGPEEVLVSSTVRDLVAGSGLRFADRGPTRLAGLPEAWRLFAAESSP
ncbi:MAG: adenylate/guanylate cyclase domain-containing protein [Myxococcota bacterium]|nr:adenylate/guanylate cyclase domain-containing protein [Myxococcota bacterium]